jgi:LysR family transcriptional regulator of gallate degradation
MMKASTLPNLRHLRVFETVARLESVSGASEEAHLSQPAVSQAMAKVEQFFGTQLFERRRSGSYPTEAGSILKFRTERLFSQIEQAIQGLQGRFPSNEQTTFHLAANKITGAHIAVLVHIAEKGGFEKAAQSIGISQASLHRTARDLEKILRRAIFRRTARGVTTTESGTELARRLKLAALEIEYAAEQIEVLRGAARSRVSIGVAPMANSLLLADGINDVLIEFPSSKILVLERPYAVLLNALRFGDIDLIYGMLRRPDGVNDISEQAFFVDPYCVAVRRNHPLTGLAELTARDLLRYDWVMTGPNSPRRNVFEEIFRKLGREPTTSIESASLTTHLSALCCSDRIGLLKQEEIHLHEQLGLLTTLPYDVPLPDKPYGITTRANWHPTPVQQRFLETICKRAQIYLETKPIALAAE